ncbi:alpha/beta fold hydrolase [Microbacterium rhizophilus]|uniref:alpha/beta fold hydrolase n=1 Tax=Microbacterium rhizophilus TaxID=3138934 RepID=UPI0031E8ABAC
MAVAPDGVPVAYHVVGHGAPLLLVHGAGLSQVVWRGSGYVDALADRFRVITIDLRGHGRSGKPADTTSYGADRLASDPVAVLDQLGVASAHYLGYSLGARVGFGLLDRHADRIRSFVSLAGTYRSTAGGPADVFFPDWHAAIEHGGMTEFVGRWARAQGGALDAQTAAAFRRNDPAAMSALLLAIDSDNGLAPTRLTKMTTPTLLLAGDRDESRASASREAADRMPRASFAGLGDRDHAGSLGARDAVLELAIPFLVGD